jgi:hypothetical protein
MGVHEIHGAPDVAGRDRLVEPLQRVAVVVRLRQQQRGRDELLECGGRHRRGGRRPRPHALQAFQGLEGRLAHAPPAQYPAC